MIRSGLAAGDSQAEAWARPGAALKGNALQRGPAALLLLSAACLTAFYYVARADVVGVLSAERGWFPLTRAPLAADWHLVAAALLLGVVPVFAARARLGRSLRDLGLGLGNWREGLKWLALGVPLALVAGWIGSRSPAMRAVYPLDPAITAQAAVFVPYALKQFLYYGAWEVLFRGVLLLGLAPTMGAAPANGVQTALSVTTHFGRALEETAGALGAGFVFGWITLRTRSIWYLALVHWMIGVSQDWFILTT